MSLENTAPKLDDEEFVDELKPGTKLMLGQYTIEDFLAAGGFGITYLARDSLDRRVVIKECFPSSFCRRQNTSVTPRSRAHQNELKSIVRLFSQEAMNLAKANHPNIVGVHQVFEENNTAYMALDYVHGRDLLEILEDDADSLKPELVEGYLTKVLGAIGHIHKLGMLHRDISPDNILIDQDGEPKLIDFGAARESSNERVTRMLSALRVVKDGYSPQEFYIAGSDQGPSCDLYSLAASFYHLITRELPPDSQTRLSACAAGDDDPYIPLGERTDAYSKRFTMALDKAMAVLPRDRMQSAEEWLGYISAEGAVTPARPRKASPAAVSAPKARKSAMPLLLAGTALVAASVGFVYISTPGPGITPGRPLAAPEVAAVVSAPSFETTPAPGPADAPDKEGAIAEIGVPADDETPTAIIAEFAALDSVTFEIARLTAPTVPDNIAPAEVLDLPGALTASLPRPMQPEAFTAAAMAAGLPAVDTAPPVAPVPVPVVVKTTAEPEPAAPDTGASSAVDFFVAMAKSEPDLVASRARTPVAAPDPAPAAPDAEVLSPIITRFVPVLPFELSGWQHGVITSVAEEAPGWLLPNARIVSVDGQPVTTNGEITAAIDAFATDQTTGSVTVSIGLDAGLNTAVTERALKVRTEKQTLLLNGLRFVSREGEEGWTTRVLDAPAASNFKVGDTLVSFISTWEDLNGPDTLQNILERELAEGTSSFSFAVSRDGEIWVEAFNLSSLAN